MSSLASRLWRGQRSGDTELVVQHEMQDAGRDVEPRVFDLEFCTPVHAGRRFSQRRRRRGWSGARWDEGRVTSIPQNSRPPRNILAAAEPNPGARLNTEPGRMIAGIAQPCLSVSVNLQTKRVGNQRKEKPRTQQVGGVDSMESRRWRFDKGDAAALHSAPAEILPNAPMLEMSWILDHYFHMSPYNDGLVVG